MKQNMVQALNVIIALPGIIGVQIPIFDMKWQTFLLLRELTVFLMAEKVSKVQLSELRELVADFLSMYKENFQDNLTAKFHFLTHYPYITRQVGPIRHLMAMRLEGKHRIFKKFAVTSNNFKNVCLTLSKRHQISFAYRCLTNKTLLQEEFKGCGKSVEMAIGNIAGMLQPEIQKYFASNLTIVSINKKVSLNGVLFIIDDLIYLGTPENSLFPCFFQIKCIILHDKRVYFLGYSLRISNTDAHLQAFVVQPHSATPIFKLVEKDQMRSPWCFKLRTQQRTKTQFIALQSIID